MVHSTTPPYKMDPFPDRLPHNRTPLSIPEDGSPPKLHQLGQLVSDLEGLLAGPPGSQRATMGTLLCPPREQSLLSESSEKHTWPPPPTHYAAYFESPARVGSAVRAHSHKISTCAQKSMARVPRDDGSAEPKRSCECPGGPRVPGMDLSTHSREAGTLWLVAAVGGMKGDKSAIGGWETARGEWPG
ncbi:unnamed protein product [Arctogadus glacialis]